MQKLNEQDALTVLERRAADNGDAMTETEAAVSAAMAVFSDSAATVAGATAAAQAAVSAIREQTNLPVKLAEFGRDINMQKRMDISRRAEACQWRTAQFDAKRQSSMHTNSSYQKIERESSTNESDSETKVYQSNWYLLLHTADQNFDDTSDELCSTLRGERQV